MTQAPLIDIGVACSGAQHPNFWSKNFARILQMVQSNQIEIGRIMAISSALPDFNKTEAIGMYASTTTKKRNQLTDANRNVIAKNFMKSDAMWLFMVDDDVVVPENAIVNLLKLKRPFAAGIYFNSNPPFNPIAYMLAKDGIGYDPIYYWSNGAITEVDSVGMGCTLIHKSVFEKIGNAYHLFVRPNGSLVPVLNKDIKNGIKLPKGDHPSVFVSEGWMHMKVLEMAEDDNRLFPFFAMEYGRTEDHYFCEMAASVGVKPVIDTSIICDHIKSKEYGFRDYREYADKKEASDASNVAGRPTK